MRVRPVFWYLLFFVCIGVLIFAASIKLDVPAILHVQVEQQLPVSSAYTTLSLRLTDSEGLPIQQAQVVVSAHMTNMEMVTNEVRIRSLGNGNYQAQLLLYMAGPWEVHIEAHANDFRPSQQALFLQVA